jgi:uncharacterized protein
MSMTHQEFSDFLAANPMFLGQYFSQNPQQLASLYIPHAPGGKAVSLVERQVEVLREKLKQFERGTAQLVRTARDNEGISDTLLDYARQLLAVQQPERLTDAIELQLKTLFNLPYSALRVWEVADQYQGLHCAQPVEVEVIQMANSMQAPYCGPNQEFKAVSWLDAPSSAVKSLALIPLRSKSQSDSSASDSKDTVGLLVLASSEADRFTEDMGTSFLVSIGELVAAALSRLVAAE